MVQLEISASDLAITPNTSISLQGKITVPGDKSISHRSLMLGAISQGTTTIEGLLLGEDPQSTAACLTAMGVKISKLNSEKVTVEGVGIENLAEPKDILDAGNSGTTMRLMLGLLASSQGKFFCITGDESLRSRPMSRVIKPLTQMGAKIWGRQDNNLAPLAIQGQNLQPVTYHSPVASAQVKSCILLAGLSVEGKTTVVEPTLSRDHSERMLRAFGAEIETDLEKATITVTGKPQLTGQRVVVPGDISSAAFWLVAGAIIPDSDIVIERVGVNPTRIGILTVLQQMGADIVLENSQVIAGEPVADLHVRSSKLTGCTIAGNLIPSLIDEIPILAVAAIAAQGTTVIKDAAELRVKESDRLAVMASELNRLGAKITELPDGLEITGGRNLTGTEVDSYGDHRVAMSLAIAAMLAKNTTTIHRAGAIAVSYPDFLTTLKNLCN